MTKASRKTSIRAIALSFLFFFSSIGASVLISPASAAPNPAAPVAAAPLTAEEANWAYTDGNQFAQDYNPQTQINSGNAQNLGISWLFPVPASPASLASAGGGIGVDTTPLIVNGTIYAVTQYGQVFAINAATGNELWTDVLPIRTNSTLGLGAGNLNLHLHQGEQTFTSGAPKILSGVPTYWISAPDHNIYAINALTGKYETVGNGPDGSFSYYHGTSDVQGNSPTSIYTGLASNIVFDLQRGIMLTGMLSQSRSNAARCFVDGWNMEVTPPALMWTAYCTPPQPNSNVPLNNNWDVQQVNNMTGAQIFYPGPAYNGGGYIPGTAVVDLKTLSASQLNATLYNDWGYSNQSAYCLSVTGGQSTGATGSGWGGSWLVDQKTGVGYVNTGNRGPYAGACNPGPDLWQASMMALNDQTGQWIWGFQTSAHDNWDWDCSWYQGLANETIAGVNTQVLIKTCKNGYLYELNAANGKMIWAWTPPTSIVPRCQYCFMQDPLNRTQMTNAFASPNNVDFIAVPSEAAGFESTAAYSPVTNMIYVSSHNVPGLLHYVPLNSSNYGQASGISSSGTFPENATVEAVNAATGQMVWSHYVATTGFRGGLMTSGNVVYAPLLAGDLLMFNAQTGALIKDMFIGAPIDVVPAIGATTSGQEQVILSVGSASFFGPDAPGDVMALQLQNIPAPNTVTTTSVSTTVAFSTTTTTTTVGGGTATVTVSGTGSVTTVTSSTSTGVSLTALYGVAAVAVILAISTGYLAMRGRKPGS
jgi:outer membrane protein assembly factor BamB